MATGLSVAEYPAQRLPGGSFMPATLVGVPSGGRVPVVSEKKRSGTRGRLIVRGASSRPTGSSDRHPFDGYCRCWADFHAGTGVAVGAGGLRMGASLPQPASAAVARANRATRRSISTLEVISAGSRALTPTFAQGISKARR